MATVTAAGAAIGAVELGALWTVRGLLASRGPGAG